MQKAEAEVDGCPYSLPLWWRYLCPEKGEA
jgi:hypothetical protein